MTNSLFIIMTVFFLGSATTKYAQMTIQEQDSARNEIRSAVSMIFRSLEKLDIEALSQIYSNTSDFILFTTDASITGPLEAKNHHLKWFESLTALKITQLKDEFRFLKSLFRI